MKKPIVVLGVIVAAGIFVVLAIYGTVSPCGILEKKMRVYASRITAASDNTLAGALAGTAIDRMIENEIATLGPAQCLGRLINFGGRLEGNAVTLMKSNLRNVAAVQESYKSDHGAYSPTMGSLDYTPSPLVEIIITTATKSGWAAEATHPATDKRCALFYGDVGEASPANYGRRRGLQR